MRPDNLVKTMCKSHLNTRSRYAAQAGITLIELMVVVAVVAILGSIAVNSYRGYLLRSNRTEAKTALLRIQVAQEKFFLQNNRYAKTAEIATAPPGGLGVATTTPGAFYNIDLSASTDTSYTARAQAINGQTADSASCRTLTITDTGVKSPADSTGCWK